MGKQKKHHLAFENDLEFDLIGICSPHPDYRIAWDLNSNLKWQLGKAPELFVNQNKKGTIVSKHPYYVWMDEENFLDVYLIKNKNENKYLIPEYNQIDYFIIVNNLQLETVAELLEKVKKVGTVMAAFSYDPTTIPSAENIIL